MNYLLDEQLSADAAAIMAILGADSGDEYTHIDAIKPPLPPGEGFPDESIPQLCADHSISVIISANVHDFGAKKALYEALLEQGMHVVVLRPGKVKFSLAEMTRMLSASYQRVQAILRDAEGPTLIRVSASGDAVARTIAELAAEIAEPKKLP